MLILIYWLSFIMASLHSFNMASNPECSTSENYQRQLWQPWTYLTASHCSDTHAWLREKLAAAKILDTTLHNLDLHCTHHTYTAPLTLTSHALLIIWPYILLRTLPQTSDKHHTLHLHHPGQCIESYRDLAWPLSFVFNLGYVLDCLYSCMKWANYQTER